jgi:PRC-barrel domain
MVDRRDGADPLAQLKGPDEQYKVYDSHYEKIGEVNDVVLSEDGRVLYVGVGMGFFGTNSTLIPAEIIRVNDRRRLIEVSEPAEAIKHAPHFGRSEDLTPELENHVRAYFGLENLQPSPDHAPQGPDISEDSAAVPVPEGWAETVPIERVETDGSLPESTREAHRGDAPERAETKEPTGQQEPAPAQTGSEEPISERLSEKSEGPLDRLKTGGVTVHRLKR